MQTTEWWKVQKIKVIVQRLHSCAFHPLPPTGKAFTVYSNYTVYRKDNKSGIRFTVLIQKEIFVPFWFDAQWKKYIFEFCPVFQYLSTIKALFVPPPPTTPTPTPCYKFCKYLMYRKMFKSTFYVKRMCMFFIYLKLKIIGSFVYMDGQFASFNLTFHYVKNVWEFPAVNFINEDHAICSLFLFICMDSIQFIWLFIWHIKCPF